MIKTMNDIEIEKIGLDVLSNEERENMYISYTSDYRYDLKENEEYIIILSNSKVTTIMASGYGIFKENNSVSRQSANNTRSFVNVLTGKEFNYNN